MAKPKKISKKDAVKINQLLTQALAFHQSGQLPEAQSLYRQTLKISPSHFDALHLLGVIAGQNQQSVQAVELISRAIAVNPGNAEAYVNRGNALGDLQRFEEALKNYDQALRLRPNYADALYARGNALKSLGRYYEALQNYDAAIALQPEDATLYWNKAWLKLLLGDYQEGWRLYEWRWKYPLFASPQRGFQQPLWLGEPTLANKTLLLHAEQGLGDSIQFCRFIPLLAAQHAKILLEAPKALLPLLATLKADITLIAEGSPLPEFDYHCPLMSLPLACGTTFDTVPAAVPYLFANHRKQQLWRERLGKEPFPAWFGMVGLEDAQERPATQHRPGNLTIFIGLADRAALPAKRNSRN